MTYRLSYPTVAPNHANVVTKNSPNNADVYQDPCVVVNFPIPPDFAMPSATPGLMCQLIRDLARLEAWQLNEDGN
jgi:hypothetical protein